LISQDLIKINIEYLSMENNKILGKMRGNAASIAPNIDPSLYNNTEAQRLYKEQSGNAATNATPEQTLRMIKKNRILNAQFKENLLEINFYIDKLDVFDV
jgi:hypothetical protein